jgi:hypothetical protein
MNTESIKACPFCGGEVEIKQTGKNELTIRCTKCLTSKTQAVLRYSLDWLREKLIEGWNARAEPAIEQSQSEQGYSEAEVKELLRQQREKCARAYLDNFKNHGILNAPEPQLKSSVKPQP